MAMISAVPIEGLSVYGTAQVAYRIGSSGAAASQKYHSDSDRLHERTNKGYHQLVVHMHPEIQAPHLTIEIRQNREQGR